MEKSKVRIILGLALLYVVVLLNWQWVWGLLFLAWAIPALFSGTTYFMEPVEKKTDPILYWAITLSWIWMSIYMISTSVFPQLNTQNYKSVLSAKDQGNYQDTAVKFVHQELTENQKNNLTPSSEISQKEENLFDNSASSKDTLAYKSYHQKATHYFVGISTLLNTHDPNLEKQTKELWDYFYQKDITEVISNIIDERIYFIYAPVGQQGAYKATIAFRTKDLKDIYNGLDGVSIPPTKYAVFEQGEKVTEKFIAETWADIYNSDLDIADGFNLEVYELDEKFNIKKSEIRIAIN